MKISFLKVLLYSGATMCCSHIPAHAALELYSDFETPSSMVKAIGGSGAVGRLNGEAPVYVDGAPASIASRSKKSLRLGGAGFVYFTDVDSPELSDAWTISTFVKFDVNVSGAETIVMRPGAWTWQADLARRVATFAVSGSKNALNFALPANFAGKWHMLTLVKSGNIVEFFFDGKSQGKKIISETYPSFGALYVGAASSKAGKAAHGNIDDLSIWSNALTSAQVQRLFAGTPAMKIAGEGQLKREPTLEITDATPVYPIKTSMDAAHSVIAAPEDPSQMALAENVRDALNKAWGTQLQISPIKNHSDGTENIILLGAGMAHPLSRELAGNQQIQRNIKGPELRIFPEALDWKRGVVYLGGRNDAEVLSAMQKLIQHFPKPDHLTFTIDAQKRQELTPPDVFVQRVRDLYAGREPRKTNLTIKNHMQDCYDLYLATGDERYVTAFDAMLKMLADNYQSALKYSSNMPPSFEFQVFPQFCYLLENSPKFTEADRRRAGELMRVVAEGFMDSWEMSLPQQSYAVGKQKYFTNHYNFSSRSTAETARYLLSRYNMTEMNYFKAVAENTLNADKAVPLSPEDAGGYQYLVYRIYCDYMLSVGKLNKSFFTSPEYLHYMDYAKMSMNHLGYTSGYGDAYPTGMRGGFVPMRENMEFTGDPESAAILSLVGRTVGDTGFYADSIRDWGIPLDLPLPKDPRFLGLRLFTVDQVRARLLGLTDSDFPKLDKAFFRSSWNPDNAEFMAINGLNGSPHGHDDAIGVSQYIKGPHLWILEGDYIRRYTEHHNLISVIRDGQAAKRQRNRIPDKERFAQVVGSAQSKDQQSAAVTLLLENNNGVNYYRHIGWETDGGFWIIDEMVATQPGDYRFASRWRTTGDVVETPQGAMVTQKKSSKDDQLNHFSIAEATGATRLGYSELERCHGRGTGDLAGYTLSDQVTRTVMFWKDARLQPGQKVLFAQYFRVVPGQNPQPVEVQRLGENAFAAGTGADRRVAVIGSFDGVSARALFAGPRGTLAIDPQKTDAAAVAKVLLAQGEIVKNTVPVAPANAPQAKLNELRQFDAQVSSSASGKNHVAVGLANGEFYLLSPDASQAAKVQLAGEITAIASIETPDGEQWAVGTRPIKNTDDGSGYLHLIDASGKVLWKKEVLANRGRQGAPKSIFEAHLDGPNKPVSIIMGPESWRYAAYDLKGNERWFIEQAIHGAMAGAAGDLDGDGRDEVFAGCEYYSHEIISPDGKTLKTNTTAPRDLAAIIGDPDHKGINRVFSARSDGFLYSESVNTEKARDWSVNLGGPAHGIVLQNNAIAAATINGAITRVDANGNRLNYTQLPAPLTGLALIGKSLFAPGLDGRIYQVNPTTLQLEKTWETGGFAESDLYFPQLFSSGDALFVAEGNGIYAVK
jgi:hypothetical protein